ncbi:hypothetical protein H5410_029312 [Solanum commersonii]|uniref:DUF4283 domain-containing protein n=1 Tax=Solanum commersonii TaxID=4109 RepID=A0A9J5Z8M7_SOLCO|nr:hypothetical protein H5410_029312 [Solanum commersonii]
MQKHKNFPAHKHAIIRVEEYRTQKQQKTEEVSRKFPCAISMVEPKDMYLVGKIKIGGLPLQFWSQSTFKAIGDICGGWTETEEETQLQNHLKWARIKVEGNGSNVPREVTIDDGSLRYTADLDRKSGKGGRRRRSDPKAPLKVDITQRSISFMPKLCERDCTLSKDKSVVADQPRDIQVWQDLTVQS